MTLKEQYEKDKAKRLRDADALEKATGFDFYEVGFIKNSHIKRGSACDTSAGSARRMEYVAAAIKEMQLPILKRAAQLCRESIGE